MHLIAGESVRIVVRSHSPSAEIPIGEAFERQLDLALLTDGIPQVVPRLVSVRKPDTGADFLDGGIGSRKGKGPTKWEGPPGCRRH